MAAKLYGTSASNPSHTVRLMLEHKGIEHDIVWLLPGLHPQLVRTRGFRGNTVPALKIDGRRLQNSREISRVLDEIQPDPPLFPTDPSGRPAVEEAERWGELVFQNVPRRIYRWMAANRQAMRTEIARDLGMPLPGLAAATNAPIAKRLARLANAGDDGVREAIAGLPAKLDHIDALLAEGVIGGEQANAADFQIVPSLRILMNMEDTAPLVEGRPCAEWADRLLPDFPAQVPSYLPEEWLRPS